MTPQDWDRLNELFDAAVRLPVEDQPAFLERACGADSELRAEVEKLLAAHESGKTVTFPAPLGLTSALARLAASPEQVPTVSEASDPLIGTRIRQFLILAKLGAGGMGAVYEAQQDKPSRTVALKVIRSGLASPELLRRFEQESQVLGRLQHPGIAQIFEAGTADAGAGPQPYFAMEFIHGQTLTQYAADHNLTTHQRMELFAKIADAVQHAHAKGVIHRDLKPGNILVTEDGQPKILDFGVARATDSDVQTTTLRTDIGQLIGTVPYMSPEQVSGDPNDLDTRSDVYALGVVLYELLAGRLPYDLHRKMVHEVARVIREEEPTRLSSINRTLRGDVETIVGKALEKDKAHRYDSASALAADIRRYLRDEPIAAVPPSTVYQLRKFAKRNKVLVGGVVAVFVTLVLGIIGTSVGMRRSEFRKRETDEALALAKAEKDRADDRAEELRRSDYISRIEAAKYANGSGDTAKLKAILNKCPMDLRGWEWYRLHRLADRSLRTLFPHDERTALLPVVFSPDGTRIVTGGEEGTLQVWDAITGSETMKLGHRDLNVVTSSVAFSPDGKWLASGNNRMTVEIWDTTSGKRMNVLRGNSYSVVSIAISPDGKRIVSGLFGAIEVRSIDSGGTVLRIEPDQKGVNAVAFGSSGMRIASAGDDGTVKTWNAATGTEVLKIAAHGEPVTSVAFSPDSKRIVTGSLDNTVKIWDATYGGEIASFRGHKSGVRSVAYSPDGKHIVSGGDDSAVILWDLSTGTWVPLPQGHVAPVTCVAFSPDAKRIVACATDGMAGLWGLDSFSRVGYFKGGRGAITSVAFSPDGKRIAMGEGFAGLQLWDATTGASVLTLRPSSQHMDTICGPAFSPNGKRILLVSSEGTPEIWDPIAGNRLMALHGHTDWARAVAISPNGELIATGGLDRTVRLWDAATGAERLTLRGHENAVNHVEFSRDSGFVISLGGDATARLWNAITGEAVLALRDQAGGMLCAAISLDGKQIAAGGCDKTAKVWNVSTGTEVLVLRGHANHVHHVALSLDGKRIVTGSCDKTVKAWDAATGAELFTVKLQVSPTDLAFSTDSKRIVVCTLSGENELKAFDVVNGSEAAIPGQARSLFPRVFAPDGKLIVRRFGALDTKDTATGQTSRVWGGHHCDAITCIAFDLNGKRIVTGNSNGTIKIWDAATGLQVLLIRGHPEQVETVAFSDDGKRIVSAGADGTLITWDAIAGTEVATTRGALYSRQPGYSLRRFAVAPDGRRSVSVDTLGLLKTWNMMTGAEVFSVRLRSGEVEDQHGCIAYSSVSFSPDSRWIASTGYGVSLRDAQTGAEVASLGPAQELYQCVAFSPDGTRLAAGGEGHVVRVWDLEHRSEIMALRGHTGSIRCVAFSPDGSRIVTRSDDLTVKVWDATPPRPEALLLRGHIGSPDSIAFSPDGAWIVSAGGSPGSSGYTTLWDVRTGEEMLQLCQDDQAGIAFSADGSRLAVAREYSLGIIDATTGVEALTFRVERRGLTRPDRILFTPDGKHLIGCAGTLWRLDTATGTQIVEFHTLPDKAEFTGFAISPDGGQVVTGDWSNISLWDTETGKPVRSWNAVHASSDPQVSVFNARAVSVAFSPDGRWIASGGSDGMVRLWLASTGVENRALRGHVGQISNVTFSPDSRRLVSASDDTTVRIWDVDTGTDLMSLKHTSEVTCVAFSPDGKRIVSGSKDQTLRVWDCVSEEEHQDEMAAVRATEMRGRAIVEPLLAELNDPTQVADLLQKDQSIHGAVKREALTCVMRFFALHQDFYEAQAALVVDELYALSTRPADVKEWIRTKTAVSETVRRLALGLAASYEGKPTSWLYRLRGVSWRLVCRAERDEQEYLLALRLAELVCNRRRADASFLGTLGAAQYRMGQYGKAIESLAASDKAHTASMAGGRLLDPAILTDVAFLAMSHRRLGHSMEVKGMLDRLRGLVRRLDARAQSTELLNLLREVQVECGEPVGDITESADSQPTMHKVQEMPPVQTR